MLGGMEVGGAALDSRAAAPRAGAVLQLPVAMWSVGSVVPFTKPIWKSVR